MKGVKAMCRTGIVFFFLFKLSPYFSITTQPNSKSCWLDFDVDVSEKLLEANRHLQEFCKPKNREQVQTGTAGDLGKEWAPSV